MATRNELLKVLEECEAEEATRTEIEKARLKEIYALLVNNNISKSINIFKSGITENQFNFESLVELEDDLHKIHKRIREIKDDIEVERLHESGEIYDWKKIKKLFTKRKVFLKFSKFKWRRFKELVKSPPIQIENHKGEIVRIDKFLARKLVIGIIQMIGNKMDLWIMNTGGEGSGKSCLSSQEMLFFYYFLHEVGLIEYSYDMKKMMKGTLRELLDYLAVQKDDSYFNISLLDEAEDLDRMNFREDDNKRFKSTMRRSRKNLNIIILNTPQIGEIDTSVTLARINLIFYCKMDYDPTTALLRKGMAEMYIIPRTKITFSDYYKKNLNREFIKSSFSKQFEKKIDYYKDLPREILIKEISFYETWGFDEDAYDKFIRIENKQKQFENGIRLTKDQMYIMFRYSPPLRDWYDKLQKESITVGSKDYHVLRKLMQRIHKIFTNDTDLLNKMENSRKYK